MLSVMVWYEYTYPNALNIYTYTNINSSILVSVLKIDTLSKFKKVCFQVMYSIQL